MSRGLQVGRDCNQRQKQLSWSTTQSQVQNIKTANTKAKGDLRVFHKRSSPSPGLVRIALWCDWHPQKHQWYHLVAPQIAAIRQLQGTRGGIEAG